MADVTQSDLDKLAYWHLFNLALTLPANGIESQGLFDLDNSSSREDLSSYILQHDVDQVRPAFNDLAEKLGEDAAGNPFVAQVAADAIEETDNVDAVDSGTTE